MRFVKTEELKTGMRIARPIYNKKGVLLYERDSRLTDASINSIKNFGLIGIYILEPAEPVPPMTDDDIEFERFQTVNVYALESELNSIIMMHKASPKLEMMVGEIVHTYGHLSRKINFIQNLRSSEDYVYKHSLNVAILSAMICHKMNVQPSDTRECILAALTHDIGRLMVPKNVIKDADEAEKERIYKNAEVNGYEFIENVFASTPNIKRICAQTNKVLSDFKAHVESEKVKVTVGARVMLVAETYDSMTAMQLSGEPASEVEALRYLYSNPEIFHPKAVEGLVESINILGPGTAVELNTGEKALVLSVNVADILRPMVLVFATNEIIDLSNKNLYDDIEIADIMKTMDNRYAIDNDTVKKFLG